MGQTEWAAIPSLPHRYSGTLPERRQLFSPLEAEHRYGIRQSSASRREQTTYPVEKLYENLNR